MSGVGAPATRPRTPRLEAWGAAFLIGPFRRPRLRLRARATGSGPSSWGPNPRHIERARRLQAWGRRCGAAPRFLGPLRARSTGHPPAP
eukprot:gene20786-biopygen13135